MTSEWPQRRPRHAVRLTAQIMRNDESCLEADVTNLSLEGCGIAGWYVIGERLTLDIPRIGKLRGQVRWAMLGRAGVRFCPDEAA